MKKIFSLLFLIFTVVGVKAQSPVIPPKSNQYINDFSGIFSKSQIEELAQISKNIESNSSTQVVVVISNDLPADYPIEMYTIELAKKWGIGQKGVNNGLLFYLSTNTRQSRIEVGYGLEGIITDFMSSRLQDNYFIPYAIENDYFNGIKQLLINIGKELSPEAIQQKKLYAQQQKKEHEEYMESLWNVLTWVGIIGLTLFLFFYTRYQKRKEKKRIESEKERITSNAKFAISKFTQSYSDLKSLLERNSDFLNANELIKKLEEWHNKYNSLIEIAPEESVPLEVENATKNFNSLFNDFIDKAKLRENINKSYNHIQEQEKNYKLRFNESKQKFAAIKSYSKDIWITGTKPPKGFDTSTYTGIWDSIFNVGINSLQNAVQELNNKNFSQAKLYLDEGTKTIINFESQVEFVFNKLADIQDSERYIVNNRERVLKIVQGITQEITHQYVSGETRLIFRRLANGIDYSSFEGRLSNPIAKKIQILTLINELNEVLTIARNEIEREKTRLKKLKERNDSNINSNGGGYYGGSQGSSSNNTSFGGGGFGGGGASKRF